MSHCLKVLHAISSCLFQIRSEEANKAFSAAVQLNDNLSEAWGLWGDYLDQTFSKDRFVSMVNALCVPNKILLSAGMWMLVSML